jgi:hypothetical protein
MERALAFFGKAEANLTAEALLTAATSKIATLEKELSDLKASTAISEAASTKLTTDLATANKSITDLTAQLATEKTKAADILAGQGIAIDILPAAGADGGKAKGTTEHAADKYARLLSEGKAREAGEFYAANSAEIFKARK